MEVSRDHQLKNAILYLESGIEFSDEGISNAVKTIFENSDLLNTLDSSTLSRIHVNQTRQPLLGQTTVQQWNGPSLLHL